MALAIFGGIFGTYMWMRAREPLPGASKREGSCVLWFVGSSSMSRWTSLQEDLAPWVAQNRGVAGVTMAELNLHFAHDTAKQAPQAIVYYAGDNDLAFGRSLEDTVADLREFLDIKTRLFGKTPVFLISLKPSPTRWEQRAVQDAYNVAAKKIALARTDIAYVDIVPLLLEQGRPGPFFNPDGLHLNDEGYRRWKVALRSTLDSRFKPDVLAKCNPNRN